MEDGRISIFSMDFGNLASNKASKDEGKAWKACIAKGLDLSDELASVRLSRTCDLCGTDGHATKIMFCNTCKLACYCSEACRVAALPEH
jgi:hypothetical protein